MCIFNSQGGHGRDSDEEVDMDDEDSLVSALGCLGPIGGLLAPELQRYQKHLKGTVQCVCRKPPPQHPVRLNAYHSTVTHPIPLCYKLGENGTI